MSALTTNCPACGQASPAGKRFCADCGAPLPATCPVCGAEVIPDKRFCADCGAPLAAASIGRAVPGTGTTPRLHASTPPSVTPSVTPSAPALVSPAVPDEERRLVTALFCDLVGFTPLSEQLDPEDVREIQVEYFSAMSQQIERYGGVVEKYAGDAVLALFGAPIAHEDDPERAVLCALEMQSAIEAVAEHVRHQWSATPAIRVGVNTGEVVSGSWNASGRQNVAVTGDAVNTAARIQSAADAGEVLVGVETMRLTRRRIRFGERRDVTLKGKMGTVPVYRAMGLRERFGERWETSERASPLVGRDREMVQLLDAWVRAQASEGQLVTVVGDIGVGKSRLLAEFVDRVAARTMKVVRARCLSYGQQISLWLIVDLLRNLFGIAEQDGPREFRDKLTASLPRWLARSDAATQADALDVVGEVLGLPPGDSSVATAGAQVRRQALERSLRLVLGALSERAPTVIVLEDVHWIDEASQDVLKAVLGDVPGLRMLVLVAQRPGWSAPWSTWGWPERITLRPLAAQEAAALAGAVLGGLRLSPELEHYVADRAGGNPFFVEEMLRALQESGGLAQRDGVASLVAGAAERLPSTLTEVLLARLDRLEGQVKGVAQVGSVIGRSFAVRLLARVMEREATALELPLSALQQAEIAFPKRGSDLEYVFKHVSMREVAYNTLVQKRRQELHLHTARAIAALYPADEYVELIAYHYAKTDEHREAGEWLERAGDHAAGVYANETAIATYEEALRRLERAQASRTALARIYEKLGKVLHTSDRLDDALQVLERAVEIYREAQDLEAVGRVTARIGRVHRDRGTVNEGVARLRPLLDLLGASGPSQGLASLDIALAHLYFAGGRYAECLAAAERAAETARTIGDDGLLAAAEMRVGTALGNLERTEKGIEALESAARRAEAVGDLDVLIYALSNLGELHAVTGMLEQGRANMARALDIAQRVGDLASMGWALVMIGGFLYYLGQWDEAEESIAHGASVIRTVGSSWYSAYPPLQLGQLQLAQGAWEEAARNLNESVAIASPIGDIQALQEAHRLLGELEMFDGHPEAAIARLEPLQDTAPLPEMIGLLAILAWAQLDTGLVAQAEQTVARALDIAYTCGRKLHLPVALRIRAMIRDKQRREAEAEADFADAVSVARTLPYPYGEARALYEWGMAAPRRTPRKQRKRPEQATLAAQPDQPDRRAAARAHLEEALAIFRRLGATKDVERTEQALREY